MCIKKPNENIFNQQGQFVSSLQDALIQILKYASILEKRKTIVLCA